MKIQCNVCEKEEASVFCCADEAALCGPCDHRVHHANKLAGKHHRFSLLHPSLKDSPRCDICQERRAIVFCQEDRAILCRECDNSIHKANEHTQKHTRFLLTGVKISPLEASFSNQSSTSSNGSSYNHVNAVGNSESENSRYYQRPLELESRACKTENHKSQEYGMDSISTSSISEYLVETLPGWHVDEFLDPCSSYNDFLTKGNDYMMHYVNNDVEGFLGPMSTQDMVPQAPQQSHDVKSAE